MYQVNDDTIEIAENQTFWFYGHFSSRVAKFQNWVLKKLQMLVKKSYI